jgi:acyl carrier protein phosphodiesterase
VVNTFVGTFPNRYLRVCTRLWSHETLPKVFGTIPITESRMAALQRAGGLNGTGRNWTELDARYDEVDMTW